MVFGIPDELAHERAADIWPIMVLVEKHDGAARIEEFEDLRAESEYKSVGGKPKCWTYSGVRPSWIARTSPAPMAITSS
jgi:hypothetical protein